VSVTDLPSALLLYAGVLGLREDRREPEIAFLRTGEGTQILLHERPARPSPTAVAIGFAVPDLEATVTAWVDAGGRVVDPPATQPWGERMAVVTDVDGHIVCLSQTTGSSA